MHLSCCEVGVRLHVEVPAQSFELTLAAKTQVEVKSRHKNSTAYLMPHGSLSSFACLLASSTCSGGDKNVDLS